MIPFLVCQFDKHTVSNLVKECFGSDFPDIYEKSQIDYIFRYLKDLHAKSVLLEFEYVDGDYIEDYSRYYVKGFNSLGPRCARLHFFSKELDHAQIDGVLSLSVPEEQDILQESYLGYLVIKPLPKTFIGRTCLKVYPGMNNGSSKKLLTRTYTVNLFGVRLTVESIAFQEQDKVVSACATTSIWCALHAMEWWQVRDIPSCSEITTNAINFIQGSSNSFPKTELTNKQILRALDVAGLRHSAECLKKISEQDFFVLVQSYIDSGLPLILGVDVYSSGGENLGGHAVCIVGYKYQKDKKALYIHDDRFGPFARATILGEDTTHPLRLELNMKNDEGAWGASYENFEPNMLIAAMPKKVRLPLSYALNTGKSIVDVYEKRVQALTKGKSDGQSLLGKVSYQVRLAEISEIKTDYLAFHPNSDLALVSNGDKGGRVVLKYLEEIKKEKKSFLTGSFARFQWVVDFYHTGEAAFTILIDATDIPQGNAVSAILIKNPLQACGILEVLRPFANEQGLLGKAEGRQDFFKSFLRRLNQKRSGFSEYLDLSYGELRAPLYIKANELFNGRLRENYTAKTYYAAEQGVTLSTEFEQLVNGSKLYMIWAIDSEGNLLVGEEIEGMGHPCLTGFKPARIAGELKWEKQKWIINAKSGRYSSHYNNSSALLSNVKKKFIAIFGSETKMKIEEKPIE